MHNVHVDQLMKVFNLILHNNLLYRCMPVIFKYFLNYYIVLPTSFVEINTDYTHMHVLASWGFASCDYWHMLQTDRNELHYYNIHIQYLTRLIK